MDREICENLPLYGSVPDCIFACDAYVHKYVHGSSYYEYSMVFVGNDMMTSSIPVLLWIEFLKNISLSLVFSSGVDQPA